MCGSGYYLTWIVFGHVLGVHSSISSTIIAGFVIHFLTATCIGIVTGLSLYKMNILNISKPLRRIVATHAIINGTIEETHPELR